jgi:hypothetical protein
MPCPRRGLEDAQNAPGGPRSSLAMELAGRIGSGCSRGTLRDQNRGAAQTGSRPSWRPAGRECSLSHGLPATAAAHPGRRRPTQSDRSQGRCRSIGGAERSFTLGSGARLPRAATGGIIGALNLGNRGCPRTRSYLVLILKA